VSDLKSLKASILDLSTDEVLPFFIKLRTTRRNTIINAAINRGSEKKPRKKAAAKKGAKKEKTAGIVESLSAEQIQAMLDTLKKIKESS
jgi:hypothetical protein|tara:strand:- start:816 stop:1082 length:267 start_codon:yes stop_codon:yes gene_type:complete